MESLLILLLTLYAFVYNLTTLIFAKIFGIRVEKFYVWYDPWYSLIKYKPKNSDTEYGLGWLPLGGYCKISGMIEDADLQPYDFLAKSFGQQLWLILCGPVLMFVSGIVVYPYTISLQSMPAVFPALFLILTLALTYCCTLKGTLKNMPATLAYLLVYILFTAIVFLLLLMICEVTPLKEHLYKFFFDAGELKGKLKIMSVEKIRLISAYLGFTMIAFNLLPLGASNGSTLVKLISRRLTGKPEPQIATILDIISMIVMLVIFVWAAISLILIIF